ncbi:MAG: hypothetical protein ACO3A4_12930 [Silvanigrellaceae bacterium]
MKLRAHRIVSASALLTFVGLISVVPATAFAEETKPESAATEGKPQAPVVQENQSTNESNPAPASATAAAPAASKPPAAPEWTFQLRAGLGNGRLASQKSFKSDRLGVGVFFGKTFPELDVSLPFLDIKNTTLGGGYLSFSGVDASADRSFSAQSYSAQASVTASPFSGNLFDLSLQGGVALQRMVSQEPLRLSEDVKYGGGLTGGAFVRTQIFDGVQLLGGVDLVLGSASWYAASLGLESNF